MERRFAERISVADLQHDAGAILDELSVSNQPTAVVRNEHAAAVLISIGAWEKAESERQLLQRLAQGEAEIASGLGYDLDDVLADADRLLQSRT